MVETLQKGVKAVSINSTSEEVRSGKHNRREVSVLRSFPLIQLPRKSEVFEGGLFEGFDHLGFPLIQLPRKSEEWGSENLAPRGL